MSSSSLRLLIVAVFALLSAASCHAATTKPDAIVAADGSGQYKTVQAAINATPQTATPANPWTILVKTGTYKELVYIQREKRGVRLVGENAATTTITFNLNANMKNVDGAPITTHRTATLQLDADDFTIENITLENSAGRVGQALAIRVDGDRAVFRNCRFLGYQDTIFINRGRQYFENCHIAGAVDFIFGGATAWFENCDILCIGNGYITAASTPKEQAYGYVFSNCRVTATTPEIKTLLGRPWRMYSSTTFMNCDFADCINPVGWNKWNVTKPADSVRYAEFNNTGPGAAFDKRVEWSKKLTAAEAASITPAAVLGGTDNWNPSHAK